MSGGSPVVIVSAEEDVSVIGQCISAGAKGYVPKSASGTSILNAITKVLEGGVYVPSDLSPGMLTDQLALSDKQLKVLALIVQGKSNKEIAERLFLSEGTIKQYVTKLLRVLEVDNRVQASIKGAELLAIARNF